tara:strand:+ start:10335 stop:11336 length:1002 start_codon:yes stop_codon:yes gene_type:complete
LAITNSILSQPIFIAGTPRSGTTWVANVLEQARNTRLIKEPDNEKYSFLALWWKNNHHRFPFSEINNENPGFAKFYAEIFKGNYLPNRTVLNNTLLFLFGFTKAKTEKLIQEKEAKLMLGSHHYSVSRSFIYINRLLNLFSLQRWKYYDRLVVKSVHSCLLLPLISELYKPKMLLIFRHPANVVASNLKLGLHDGNRKLYMRPEIINSYLHPFLEKINELNDPLEFQGLQVGIFYYIWEKWLQMNPSWITINHEELCINPVESFKLLYEKLNLPWSVKVEEYITNQNKEGEGFTTQRLAENEINKWKTTLKKDQIEKIRQGYYTFPLAHYNDF